MRRIISIEKCLEELGNPSADRDYQPGHERVLKLLAGITKHRPELRIRIAGTNGKGSTATMLATALQTTGLRIGLYTSPHLLEFNERIRINHKPVNYSAMSESLARLLPLARAVDASYFETATALALDQFARSAVDVEILEAGVGARLDATTAVPADMALITPIGFDHQLWLGNTLDEIATEKAFAMKGCRWSISAPQNDEVAQALRDFNPDICFADPCDGDWNRLKTPGRHQRINATLAYAAIKLLYDKSILKLDLKQAHQAITNCVIPGRLQHIHIHGANVWLDAAHNRHAVEALLPSLPGLARPFDAILVFTREDRSLNDALSLLKPFTRKLISNNQDVPNETCQPNEALQQAIGNCPGGSFLVLGSFTTVTTILEKSE
jgi:dihydrofolate synthase/folylpolyglutamate synthase